MNDQQVIPFVLALLSCVVAIGFVMVGDWASGALLSCVTLISTTLYDVRATPKKSVPFK